MTRYGWRAFFLVQGFGGMLWLIPWYFWMPRGTGLSGRGDAVGMPGTADVLRQSFPPGSPRSASSARTISCTSCSHGCPRTYKRNVASPSPRWLSDRSPSL
jgi:hypothetical protein